MKDDITCPYCGKKETWQTQNPHRPFCSERCKLIDLGDWADEKHRIPVEQESSEDKLSDHENDR